ncbi:MAG: PHB depolymerase family esterase [Myxococcales bacterium]|nr:PHB depolymerase family esterase [Myxococcales bacterium]
MPTPPLLDVMSLRSQLLSFVAATVGLLAAPSALAASLQPVSGWEGGMTFPSDVSMYAYVPNAVAANPPILTLIHFCGGSAQAVFGQAQGGGVVGAADKNGFILVVPSNANASGANGRCWDITSKATQTRDGGGDSHAIVQMVRFAISQYHANPNRVYSTGDSSGAMMTQLLLALYPDVYKAGSSFAGVPAGCQNAFDGQGLCGLGTQTAQQWGDRVRAMDPGYTGHRPRVQLVQGDMDQTINFKNFGEGIKEWTSVLGLTTAPTSTATGLTLGMHQATRQSWKDSCGYVVLDTLESIGGDHGPSDALFASQYVIPFLGLDQTGAVDPEIAQCGADGGGGSSPSTDGGLDAGSVMGGDAGRGRSDAGASSGGGSSGSGGGSSSGGTGIGSSGSGGAGTDAANGGTSGNGGGSGSSGGAAGSSSGSSGGGGGSSPATTAGSDAGGGSMAEGARSNGCGCGLAGLDTPASGGLGAGLLGLGLTAFRRRRRAASSVGRDSWGGG